MCCFSVAQSCPTLCDPMDCSTPGFPVLHQLPELAQTHIHWVSDAIQPSHPLSSTSPPEFNLSQHQGLFPMSRLFTSGGPSFRASASASVLSVNIHDLFPLQLIFSPRDSQESFPINQLFTWGGQSIGVSSLASVLPKNTQDWSPLVWTGWISLQSKGLSRVFSNTTVQKHQFFGAQLSL